MKWPHCVAVICLGLVSAVHGEASTLRVQVENLRAAPSALAYALFDSAKGFPGKKELAYRREFVPVTIDPDFKMRFEIPEVPPGNYALLLYQDLNQNQSLDKNFVGIPKEPVGASNNPTYHFGPPRYQECLFSVNQPEQDMLIKMVD